MAITAKELIECIQGMGQSERRDITQVLSVITCSEEYSLPIGMPAMPFCDPFREMVANLTPEGLEEIREMQEALKARRPPRCADRDANPR